MSFGSWRLAALGFVSLIAALAGGVAAAHWTEGIESLASIAGLLAVFGIAARNVMMFINRAQRRQKDGMTLGPDLVRQAARERLAPTLMTAATVGLVLLPIVFLGDIAGLEILRPMAVVVLAGLASSTLVTLFIIPSLYLLCAPSGQSGEIPEPSSDGSIPSSDLEEEVAP